MDIFEKLGILAAKSRLNGSSPTPNNRVSAIVVAGSVRSFCPLSFSHMEVESIV